MKPSLPPVYITVSFTTASCDPPFRPCARPAPTLRRRIFPLYYWTLWPSVMGCPPLAVVSAFLRLLNFFLIRTPPRRFGSSDVSAAPWYSLVRCIASFAPSPIQFVFLGLADPHQPTLPQTLPLVLGKLHARHHCFRYPRERISSSTKYLCGAPRLTFSHCVDGTFLAF